MDKEIKGREALAIACRELDDCHFQMRQDQDEIKNLRHQVFVLRTENENREYKMWVDSLAWKAIAMYSGILAIAALIFN